MGKRLPPLTLPADPGVVKITPQQWRDYVAAELTDQRGELETVGPWQLPLRYSAPAVTAGWGEHGTLRSITLWGRRTMHAPRECGYVLRGRASLAGHKVSCFTSSQLFQLPDGTLLETATLHCQTPQLAGRSEAGA